MHAERDLIARKMTPSDEQRESTEVFERMIYDQMDINPLKENKTIKPFRMKINFWPKKQ